MSEAPRFCKDCKYVVIAEPLGIMYAKCGHERAVYEVAAPDYLVTGNGPRHEVKFCATMRLEHSQNCGPEGELWEAREPAPQTDFAFEPVTKDVPQ